MRNQIIYSYDVIITWLSFAVEDPAPREFFRFTLHLRMTRTIPAAPGLLSHSDTPVSKHLNTICPSHLPVIPPVTPGLVHRIVVSYKHIHISYHLSLLVDSRVCLPPCARRRGLKFFFPSSSLMRLYLLPAATFWIPSSGH
jgi:hypothetical protein